MASCLSCFFVSFAIQFCSALLWAAQPYQPVHPDPLLDPWRWRTFPELKGLGLRCMAGDRDGNLWFGTAEGAHRYDGTKWTVYTPEDGLFGAPVTALCAARDGSVYAGTSVGISRFSDGAWSRVFPPEGDLTWPVDDLMQASDGSVWAGTVRGALRLDREGPALYTTEAYAAGLRMRVPGLRLSIVPDEAAPDRPWSRPYASLTGEGIGVLAVSGLISALAPGGPGERAGLKIGDRIVAVDGEAIDPSSLRGSTTWRRLFGPAGTSVILAVRREGQPEPFEVAVTREHVEGTFRDFRVYDIFEDREGALWFGLWPGEIVRCDIRRTGTVGAAAWRLYTEADGLDIGYWPQIAQTRDGAIWTISGDGYHGVNRFDGQAWTHVRLRDVGGGNQNTAIQETRDGTLWVSGKGSLGAFRNNDWTIYRTPDIPVPSTRIISLVETSDGALWVAGRGQEAARLDLGADRWTTYEGLNFQCEMPDGSIWFLSQDGTAVRYDPSAGSGQGGRTWTRYGVEDGLMNFPLRLIATRRGVLWAAGSHDSMSATARFDGKGWSLQTHPELSEQIDPRAVYESSDGALWFGSRHPRKPVHLGGVLRHDGQAWTHHTAQETGMGGVVYGIGQTADGALWFGGMRLIRFDGGTWTSVTEPEELAAPFSDVVYAGPNGDLWVGTRTYGAFHYDPSAGPSQGGGVWTRYDVRDGLADSQIQSILQADDGSVWVSTQKGISRFDGQTWTTHALPPDLRTGSAFWGGSLRQSRDGAIWINRFAREETRWVWVTTRYVPDADPPDTEITLSLNEVSQPGNTTLAWTGVDPWRETPDGELQYAWRLDGGDWSPFTLKKSEVFLSLSSGPHIFEVKSRDRAFNEDPSPAAVRFRVVPPVWQQPWFIGLMAALLGGIAFQTVRVVRRDRRLRESNTALSSANKELFGLNQELQEANRALQRERASERIRGQVQAMEQASDFENVLSVLAEDLKTVGLSFDTCGIDVLDDPVDEPSMAYFEEHGFRYTTYTIDPEGAVTGKSTHLSLPFPDVMQETIERFLAGRPWQGRSERTAIIEVPASSYGRLRITSSDRQDFAGEEVDTLQDFADAIALGYARYLDFRQIQEATERKSRFLASMSHELRTPMNAIIGFTRMVLRRTGDILPELQKENLEKVTHSANHLLNLINELLDLSKIEAGRMDVNVERFDVKEMIATCCASVTPLVKPDVELKHEVADGVGEANTDAGRLRQVVMNLLSNALKFTDRGEVAVRVSKDGQAEGEALLVISVSDTGSGIPADALETIFDEFQQVKGSDKQQQGTGLGLAITKRFAELMGGTIGVVSEVGKGSTFTVRVPVEYKGG